MNRSDDTAVYDLTNREISLLLTPLKRLGIQFSHRGNYIEMGSVGAFGRRAYSIGQLKSAIIDEIRNSDDVHTRTSSDKDTNSTTSGYGSLEQLRADNKRLREKGRQALAERDRWRTEAERLKALVDQFPSQDGKYDFENGRFSRIKREFAKLYHPDNSAGKSAIEQMIRTEFFKEFWSIIETIERS
jgi:hypothetical protein